MTTAPTIHRQAVRSSVALKALMAVTGLAMIAFLLMHMFGNLKAFLGPGSFDGYAEWLKGDILHPLLPSGTFIWVFRFGMVAVIVGHMYSAAQLWKRARRASPGTYAAKRRLAQTYSSRTMRWGGVILALGLVFHLLQFTVKATLVSAPSDSTPYEMIVAEFSVWWLVLCYAAWMVTVCMHIRHGFWSAFATLG
ncbi:MAG: succinate dehydrogenase cytochrome b subunit, partial [Propionibacteriaceae bacterium]|nr:succinate dehydrogenase cytochrome b subunit [Propionibacteriaceae bacterium]